MKNIIEINGNKYDMPEIDFNAVCDLADIGVDILDMKKASKKPFATARAIVAWVIDTDTETAGMEIQKDLLSGGSLEKIFSAFMKEVENSSFFKQLQEERKKEVAGVRDHQKKAQ